MWHRLTQTNKEPAEEPGIGEKMLTVLPWTLVYLMNPAIPQGSSQNLQLSAGYHWVSGVSQRFPNWLS